VFLVMLGKIEGNKPLGRRKRRWRIMLKISLKKNLEGRGLNSCGLG
jgi:hypothetical protein